MIVSHLNVIALMNEDEFFEANLVFLVSAGIYWKMCFMESFKN